MRADKDALLRQPCRNSSFHVANKSNRRCDDGAALTKSERIVCRRMLFRRAFFDFGVNPQSIQQTAPPWASQAWEVSMKSSINAALVAGLLSLGSAANAELVTWDFKGQLGNADPATPYRAGDSFEALVTFDTAAAVLPSPNTSRYSLDITSLKISYQIGAEAWKNLDASAGGLIYVRDNQVNPDASAGGALVDGLTFSLGTTGLILRWNDLSALDFSQRLVPATPPALVNMVTNSFQDSAGAFTGSFASVTAVPEPTSYSMILVGLGLMGALCRRRLGRSGGQ